MTREQYEDERLYIIEQRRKLNTARRDLDERWLTSLFYPEVDDKVRIKIIKTIDKYSDVSNYLVVGEEYEIQVVEKKLTTNKKTAKITFSISHIGRQTRYSMYYSTHTIAVDKFKIIDS